MTRSVKVIGLGIVGLWQALVLSRAGFRVDAVDTCGQPFAQAASRLAGAMLAPFCERESAEPIIAQLGQVSLALWKRDVAQTICNGSLVVVPPRDTAELKRFGRATEGFEWLDGDRIAELEPSLEGRFGKALFFPTEAHVETRPTLQALLELLKSEVAGRGGSVRFEVPNDGKSRADDDYDWIVDCRGLAAQDALPDLRGVRGEMVVVRSTDIRLSRPVRLIHPRFPLYIVPWTSGQTANTCDFMIGATMVERADARAVTVRSALELLGAAYAVHPGFAEAEIIEMGSGVRPAFPDNIPRVVVRGRRLYVNGMYRHGFLLAPALAEMTQRLLVAGADVAGAVSGAQTSDDEIDLALASWMNEIVVEDNRERNPDGYTGTYAG